MKKLLKKYKHIWVVSYAFIYLPWFRFLEKNVTDNYAVMHVTLDDLIPFEECFIIPYLLWFAYVASAFGYFFISNKQDFYRLCTFLFTGMTVSLLVCTFFPNGTDLRVNVNPNQNIFCRLVCFVHMVDTPTNVFPSVHVYNSLGVHFAITSSASLKGKRWLRICSLVLMVAICLSTIFLKQHSIVDVLGAMILAWAMYSVVYGINYESNRRAVHQKAAG